MKANVTHRGIEGRVEQWLNAWCAGFVLAAMAAAAARPRLLDAAGRYRAWSAALLGLAALLAVPAINGLAPALSRAAVGASGANPGVVAVPSATGHEALIPLPPMHVPVALLLALWAPVAAWRGAVLAVSLWRIRAARAATQPFPAGRSERLPEWTAASRGRFALALSDRATSACMLGFGRPLVVLPASWLDRFPDAELDAVLLHELAHAERRDDVQHLAQELVLAACWFHPAAWWIAHRMAFEREAACDDRAARRTTVRTYARCLLRIAEALQAGRLVAPKLAASSARHRSALARRIERLAHDGAVRMPMLRTAVSLTALALVAGALVHGGSLPPVFGIRPPESVLEATAGQAAVAPPQHEAPLATRRAGAPPTVGRTSAQTVTRRSTGPSAGPRRPAQTLAIASSGRLATTRLPETRDSDATASPGANASIPDEPSLAASREWGTLLGAPLPSTAVALRVDRGQNAGTMSEGRPGRAAPFRGLSAALSQAGKRTGQWFSRAGASIGAGLTPR